MDPGEIRLLSQDEGRTNFSKNLRSSPFDWYRCQLNLIILFSREIGEPEKDILE
jgi:hypothetical protein